MRAFVIDAFGPPGVFRSADLPTPTPGPGAVLVRVAATSVNPVDYKIRSGAAAALAPAFPATLHMDVAGTVEALGPGVDAFAVGEAVFGCAGGMLGAEGPLPGALADFMVCDARLLAPKPPSLSFEEAAALPLVWLTAWEGLAWTKARVRAGDRVLVYGGTGGVGHVAVQLACALGAEVTATASTEVKRETARALGATHVSDHHAELPEELSARVTGGAGFDVVFDTVGGAHVQVAARAARPNGHVVTVGVGAKTDVSAMSRRALSLDVVWMLLPMFTGEGRERHGHALREAARLFGEGRLRPLLDAERFAFEDAAGAHARAESGEATGKVVLMNPAF